MSEREFVLDNCSWAVIMYSVKGCNLISIRALAIGEAPSPRLTARHLRRTALKSLTTRYARSQKIYQLLKNYNKFFPSFKLQNYIVIYRLEKPKIFRFHNLWFPEIIFHSLRAVFTNDNSQLNFNLQLRLKSKNLIDQCWR